MFCSLQVVSVQEYWVKPRSADINENVLSEQAREELGLSEELIRKGNSLEHVISQVSERSLSLAVVSLHATPCPVLFSFHLLYFSLVCLFVWFIPIFCPIGFCFDLIFLLIF